MPLLFAWVLATGGFLLTLPGLFSQFPELAPESFRSIIVSGFVLAVVGLILTIIAQGNDDGAGYRREDLPLLKHSSLILFILAAGLLIAGVVVFWKHGGFTIPYGFVYAIGLLAVTFAASAPGSWVSAIEED